MRKGGAEKSRRGRGALAVNSGEGKKVSGKAYDPICGVRVESGEGVPSSEYKKRRYFFCSEKCKVEFERAAERIRMQETARAGALFTQGKVRWGLA
ncbi:MAG TPA: YHS domain-containing protein [Myxococcales bacterium]|nr:YHS domain-containing protein [Myxococcales bacterium]